MPLIDLPEATYSKLQTISLPFIDTPESRILQLIDEEIERRTGKGHIHGNRNGQAKGSETLREINPENHGNLRFTKLLTAKVDGKELSRPKWNGLMNHLLLLGRARLGSIEALKKNTGARIRDGRFEEDGYKYLSDGKFSIQGVDANKAWDHSLSVARSLDIAIKVTFRWREDGEHPGETALLEWSPE